MRIFSTVSILTVLLSCATVPALAQDVFMRSTPQTPPEEGVPNEPPAPPVDRPFAPFADAKPNGMESVRPSGDSPLLSSSPPPGEPQPAPSSPLAAGSEQMNNAYKGTGRFTPEQYQKAEQQMKQLAQQYPEMRVNGFTISKDIETLGKYQLQIAQKMQQACMLPSTPQVLVDPFGFFKFPKATENFPKVGMPNIIQLLTQACADPAQKQILIDLNPIIQIRNVPGIKTPGFSNDGGLINFDDDFTNAEPPGFAVSSNQLRRMLTSFGQESVKDNNNLPQADAQEMQRKMEEYEKNKAKQESKQ